MAFGWIFGYVLMASFGILESSSESLPRQLGTVKLDRKVLLQQASEAKVKVHSGQGL